MTQKNQGEGNREAARDYNRGVRQHVSEHDVEAEAKAARRAVDGSDKDALKQAERAGKARAKEFDPQVKRDR